MPKDQSVGSERREQAKKEDAALVLQEVGQSSCVSVHQELRDNVRSEHACIAYDKSHHVFAGRMVRMSAAQPR